MVANFINHVSKSSIHILLMNARLTGRAGIATCLPAGRRKKAQSKLPKLVPTKSRTGQNKIAYHFYCNNFFKYN